jgi:long-chain acyl-CoA synthetase
MNVAYLAVDGLERFGTYDSTYFEGAWCTNQDLNRRSRALASVLKEKGVEPGDRVVVMMQSCLEVSDAFDAIARLGAVIIPIMPQLIAREVRYIVEDSGAHTVITAPELVPRISEATRDIENFRQILVFEDTDESSCVNIQPQVTAAEPLDTICDCADDDLAVLVYTSGTTGHPKGVMLSHGNLICNAKSVAELFDLPRDNRSLMVLPMSHVYGILLLNLSALIGGANVMLRRFDPVLVLQAIDELQIERCSLVPTMMIALIHHPDRPKYDVRSLKRVSAGSAPLPEEVRLEFQRLFDCKVFDGYGQSEATCAVSAYRDEETYVVGSVGRALPGVDVCIQDDENRLLPAGQTGEICTRGASVMLGYWNKEQATDEAIVEGWLHSGDVGHMDARGYIFITDRKKDMIIKGGENISPREIEEAVARHASVAEVAVYGVPDPKFQEEIAISIVLRANQPLTADQAREHLRQYVTTFKIPKYVRFHDELPKNSNGKILKRTLREQWQGDEVEG